MIDKPPSNESFEESAMSPEEALRESHRERIRERILWVRNELEGSDLATIIAAMADTEDITLEDEQDILDRIIDDEAFAHKFAEMLEVETELLIQFEQIPKEVFLEQVRTALEGE